MALPHQSDSADHQFVDYPELRSSPRARFPYYQTIAPVVGDSIPRPDEFYTVRCRDVSRGGFAMYLDAPPDFEFLVVSLGPVHQLNHLRARVKYVEEIEFEGRPTFLVGCRFVERISL